jgi:hypothetical protein
MLYNFNINKAKYIHVFHTIPPHKGCIVLNKKRKGGPMNDQKTPQKSFLKKARPFQERKIKNPAKRKADLLSSPEKVWQS